MHNCRQYLSLLRNPSTINSPAAGNRTLWVSPDPWWLLTGATLCRSCAGDCRCCESMFAMAVSCPEDSISSFLPIFRLLHLPSCLQYSLRLIVELINILFRDEHKAFTYSKNHDLTCVSKLTDGQGRKKFFWLRMRVAFVYGCEDKYLDSSLA